VNMLALNSGSAALSDLGLSYVTLITVLSTLGLELLLGLVVLPVVEFPLLNTSHPVLVLLRKDLLVEDGLDGAVVVVLVDLLLNRCPHLLVTLRLDCLLCDGGADVLMDCGVMVTGLGLDVVNSLLCLLHCECVGDVMDKWLWVEIGG
jgi:hypothetical protein